MASNAKKKKKMTEIAKEKLFQCDFLIEAYFFRVHQSVLCFFEVGKYSTTSSTWTPTFFIEYQIGALADSCLEEDRYNLRGPPTCYKIAGVI